MRNIKFFILFALLLFFIIGYKTYDEYQKMNATQNLIVQNETQVLSYFITAFRQTYQDIFIEHHIDIDDKTMHLLPVKAMGEIANRFSLSTNDDIVIRTVSDRPINKKNAANDYELEMIEYFRDNPDEKERFIQDEDIFSYTKPLYIKQSCLKCHGVKENTIPSIRNKYKSAYTYKIGEIRGLLNIMVKKSDALTTMKNDFTKIVISAILLFLLFLSIIYWLIRKINEKELEDNKKLENDILLKTSEIKKQRDAFEILFEKSSDGILIIDDKKFIQCNEKAVELMQFDSKEQLLNLHPGDISPDFQPDGQNSYEKANEIMDLALEKDGYHFEWLHQRRNGDEFWTEISLTPIKLNDHKVIYTIWRDISEKKSVQKKLMEQTGILYHQAHHDALTGLPNRTMFNLRLEHSINKAKEENTRFALFFIDLDEFKRVNDSLGHELGDVVLNMIAERLKENIRKSDTLARLGGDEFVTIMEKYKTKADISLQAEKILKIFSQPIYLDKHTLYLSCSIGISIYPQDDTEADKLLKYADTAMYKAKSEGKNTYQFYSSDMTVEAYERITMEADLRRALENEEFEVYYQPQIDASKGKLIGIEALIRWIHPTMGVVSPARFIPLAEDTGFIIEIDKWVMKNATQQVIEWYEKGFNPGKLALNLTKHDLRRHDFIGMLQEHIVNTKFKTEWLEFEISERDVMLRFDEAIPKLNKLLEMGVSIAIDDFGTGHSSLAYLKNLPVNKLKIDQAFVKDIPEEKENSAIVKAVIALAQGLELDVIAEGVETQAQNDFLIANGCYYIQGYYYGKPVPAEEFEKKYLENN